MRMKLPIRRPARRRAFSFAEVMFAVIILGVGFIMIAGLFPVAISQSKSNADETSSAVQRRRHADFVDAFATDSGVTSLNSRANAGAIIADTHTSEPIVDSLQGIRVWINSLATWF